MDQFEKIKMDFTVFGDTLQSIAWKDDVEWMINEIETLRLDNEYLQLRLKREVEKK